MADLLNVSESKFQVPFNVAANGKLEKTLQTAGKFIDKDIHIEVNTPDAAFEVKSNAVPVAVASVAASDYLTTVANDHAIVVQADASKAASQVGVSTAGFAALEDVVNVPATNAVQATKTVYIKEGSIAGEADATIESDDVVFSEGSGSFEITAKTAGSVAVEAAGWIDAGTEVEISGEKTYNIQAASVKNSATSGKTYEEGHSGAVVSGGFLYIDEGYIKDTKISLAEIVPDQASVVAGDNTLIYKTVSVYDKDGALITGSMDDAQLSAITANDASAVISNVNVQIDEDNDKKFVVSGSQAISGSTSVAISSEGYATTALSNTGSISGTANVNAQIDMISITASCSDDGAVKPVIKKGEATALSGAIATSAPEGVHYVSVSADAIEKTIHANPVVSEAGYGTAEHFAGVGIDIVGGSQASDTFYIGINNGAVSSVANNGADAEKTIIVTSSCEAVGGTVDTAGVLDVAPASGKYIALKAVSNNPSATVSGSVATTVTEGYVVSASSNTQNVTANFSTIAGSDAQYIAVYEGEYI